VEKARANRQQVKTTKGGLDTAKPFKFEKQEFIWTKELRRKIKLIDFRRLYHILLLSVAPIEEIK